MFSAPKDFFVIFVVLLDVIDHFVIFGDINDSLIFHSLSEGNQNFWLKLANSFVFYGVRSVLKTSSVQKPIIPVTVLFENVKYFSSSTTITFVHKNVCQE
jgi:hypothetical protein